MLPWTVTEKFLYITDPTLLLASQTYKPLKSLLKLLRTKVPLLESKSSGVAILPCRGDPEKYVRMLANFYYNPYWRKHMISKKQKVYSLKHKQVTMQDLKS